MISLLLLLAFATFAPFVDRCGSVHFWERERASGVLARWYPLSEPALARGRWDADAEIRVRCARATAKWRSFDWRALDLLLHENETGGLPIAAFDKRPKFGQESIRLGVIEIAHAYGISTGDLYYFGEVNFFSCPTGFDYVRLSLRGIDCDPHFWTGEELERMQGEWAMVKKAVGKNPLFLPVEK